MPNAVNVVVDTNVWVSMALGSQVVSVQMAQIIQDTDVSIFISAELLEELTDTLTKPKLQRYLSTVRTKQLFELIWEKVQLTVVHSSETFCRDVNDDFIINLAIDANAQYIITGDSDLLILNPIIPISTCSLSEFIRLRGQ